MTFDDLIKSIHRARRYAHAADLAITTVMALSVAAAFLGIWAYIRPENDGEQITIAIFSFIAVLLTFRFSRRSSTQAHTHLPSGSDLRMYLEMKLLPSLPSPLRLGKESQIVHDPAPIDHELMQKANEEIQTLLRDQISAYLNKSTQLIVPILVAVTTLTLGKPEFRGIASEVKEAVSFFLRGANLRVINGLAATTTKSGDNIEIGKFLKLTTANPVDLELLVPNLIEIHYAGGLDKTTPTVELRRRKSTQDGKAGSLEVFQTFQMAPQRLAETTEDSTHNFAVTMAITEPVEVFIPILSATKPVSRIGVKQLPVPRVKLKMLSPNQNPWPDDQPVLLQIDADADNPIELVRLLIRSGERVSKETVNTVLSGSMKELSTDYRLLLEPYVESDLAEVEIVAEVVDKALPSPLVGQSEPLRITTASAYGRYRQTLQTLRELKTFVDQAISKREVKLPNEAITVATKANTQAAESPFFDGLDRMQIEKFQSSVTRNTFSGESGEAMDDLSSSLNTFLFEHEILDDRERDRDFFVAVRGLSRLIEIERASRPIGVKEVAARIRDFLDERHTRWQKRVDRLPGDLQPPSWGKIRGNDPFRSALKEIERLDASNRDEASSSQKADPAMLTILSKSVVEFRSWIEELEAKEDAARAKAEAERQQGLASARDELKELQKRQGEISTALDRADEKKKEDLTKEWPATRMAQNANARQAQSLEAKLRSLAPGAGARIKAAAEAMGHTVEQGNAGSFGTAESMADAAGRLLRQADQATKQQQQQQGSRDRGRRRRVTGDNYYGQSVVGGDVEIKREYQVDRRYREDILDEIRDAGNTSSDSENRSLLDNYLRQVIR